MEHEIAVGRVMLGMWAYYCTKEQEYSAPYRSRMDAEMAAISHAKDTVSSANGTKNGTS